jgi:hypothetical protein
MKRSAVILFVVFSIAIISCKKTNLNTDNLTASDQGLSGTKWVVYQYKDATTSVPISRTDTLLFKNATQYFYNGNAFNYYLNTSNNTHLSLGGTPFGDIDGILPPNFIANGEVTAVPFAQIRSNGPTYFIWMRKI